MNYLNKARFYLSLIFCVCILSVWNCDFLEEEHSCPSNSETTDSCASIDCGTFGTCEDGICQCEPGYEFDSADMCEALSRDKFLGVYSVSETCDSGTTDSYVSAIEESSDSITTITINNLYNFVDNTVTATIDGNLIDIDDQQTPVDFQVVGNGSITDSLISIEFTITDLIGGGSDDCQLLMTPQ